MDKKLLRKLYKEKREKILDRDSKNSLIFKRLLPELDFDNIDCVLCYMSFKTEADTSFIINFLLDNKVKVAVPKCLNNGVMNFIIINSIDELVESSYGILEPIGSSNPIITENTICIVPALAFSIDGYRLGYGGGYYDRFIQKFPYIKTIGLCFDEQIVDFIPRLPHDMQVNKIITDKRTVLCDA